MSSFAKKRQSGVAAVELAIALPLMISLVAVPLFFARLFMHYSVIAKASERAAIYFATIPRVDMAKAQWAKLAEQIAEQIVETTVAELRPGADSIVITKIHCGGSPCGFILPTNIQVVVRSRATDDVLNPFTWLFGGVTASY